MSTESARLFERALRVSPGGVHSPVRAFRGVGGAPRFIRAAKGACLEDMDGNTYVDHCLSWGPLIFGHRDEEIAAEVHRALDRGWSYGAVEPYSLELAELVCARIPWVEKVRFVSSGTEAVMSALRVARAATGRAKIVKFDGCYHGHADSMLVRAGSGLAEMAEPDSAGVSHAVAGETVVAPLDDPEGLEAVFERHGREIAAVIVEPVPANNGLLPQVEDFLPRIFRLARAAGALVVFDEVITGFRVAFGGMAEHTGLRPDLVTYGKIIGGGFPVGAYGGKSELMDLVAPAGPVYQAGTLSANPVAMTAGLAMLRKLARENPYEALAARTEKLSRAIERANPAIRVQNFSSMFWMVQGDPVSPKLGAQGPGAVRSISRIPAQQKPRYAELFHGLLAKGYYLAPSGYEVSFLSTAHTDAQLDGLVAAIAELGQ